jgi:hypothetical protein
MMFDNQLKNSVFKTTVLLFLGIENFGPDRLRSAFSPASPAAIFSRPRASPPAIFSFFISTEEVKT